MEISTLNGYKIKDKKAIRFYNTVADMIADTTLKNGMHVKTKGYYSENDGGSAEYHISNTENNLAYQEILNNNLYATLIIDEVKPEYFGAYGDGEHDDSLAFTKMFNFVKANENFVNYKYSSNFKINLYNTYNIDNIIIPENLNGIYIDGHNKGIIKNGGFNIPGNSGWKTIIDNLIFIECDNPISLDYLNKEYGKIRISNCNFINCTGTTISIRRRSCHSIIKECYFKDNEKNVYIEDNDQFTFTQNWVECSSEWEDNHIDIEQYAPNEGMAIITNNFFIPGYNQNSVNNPCWIKIGRSATIENNRFSGENASIYPVLIRYDNFDSYDYQQQIQPIINIINNPIISGKISILMDKYAGQLNIKNNSYTLNLPIIKIISNEIEEVYNNMSDNNLFIDIEGNGGRTFNFRNHNWRQLTTARPVVPYCLDKFIKTEKLYALNKNIQYKVNYVSDTKIEIEFNTKNVNEIKDIPIVIVGNCNFNPGGNVNYFENFVLLLKFKCFYKYDGVNAIVFMPIVENISGEIQNVSFESQINDADYLVNPFSSQNNLKISINYINSTESVDKVVNYTNAFTLNQFLPVALNKPSAPAQYNFENLSN